jgi:hypothetical protein
LCDWPVSGLNFASAHARRPTEAADIEEETHMPIRELLTILGVSLAVITAYSLARDLTDDPVGAITPHGSIVKTYARMNGPHE